MCKTKIPISWPNFQNVIQKACCWNRLIRTRWVKRWIVSREVLNGLSTQNFLPVTGNRTLLGETVTCRLRLKSDGTRAETRFRLSAKGTSPFKSAGASVQSTTGSRVVRISCSNAGYTKFRGNVKSTGYPLHSLVSPSISLPCVTVCHQILTGVYYGDFSYPDWPYVTHRVEKVSLNKLWKMMCQIIEKDFRAKCEHILSVMLQQRCVPARHQSCQQHLSASYVHERDF